MEKPIQSAKTRPEADCGSDQLIAKLLIAKFRVKLKKVGKTTRPFRYALNQALYDYTMEVTNASTFKPRIDSHQGGTWDSPVRKPRGKATDPLIYSKGSMKLLLQLGRKAHVHAPIRDED